MLNIRIRTQPDDETCGQTCLQAVYYYYGYKCDLNHIIHTVERSLSGGTLAPHLGIHALRHNFKTTIYINNLDIFDPTWFVDGKVKNQFLIKKLQEQMKYKWDKSLHQASIAYQEYLKLGGKVLFKTINSQLLNNYFNKKIPILTGLSATYLYQCSRELYFSKGGVTTFNDIRGVPTGHFVVLCGYDEQKQVVIADPHISPVSKSNYYAVVTNHLINAIMLGVFTYDANLLIIKPR